MTIHDKLPDAITYLELNVLLNNVKHVHQLSKKIFFCRAADLLDVLRVIKATCSYDDVCLILCYDS